MTPENSPIKKQECPGAPKRRKIQVQVTPPSSPREKVCPGAPKKKKQIIAPIEIIELNGEMYILQMFVDDDNSEYECIIRCYDNAVFDACSGEFIGFLHTNEKIERILF